MDEALPHLPARNPAGHKGTFGTVCVIGGQVADPRVMIGGPAFAAEAALRSGCGLAVLAVPRPIMASALVAAPSATGLALPVGADRALIANEVAELLDAHASSFDCIAIGPGWGADVPQQQILVRLMAQGEKPMVIDADAINAMASLPDVHRDLHCHAVLTPHPGEYRRLAERLAIDADPVTPGGRCTAAEQMAARLGCVVVLKGQGTVVSDGIRTVVNESGNAALATAGTGDVLTGIIAGFVAQFFRPSLGTGTKQIDARQQGGLSLFDCARLGVDAHGRAADAWAATHGEAGMLARDLLDEIPDVLKALAGGGDR